MFDQAMLALMGEGILETLYMTLASTLLAYAFGLPLGVLLVVTDEKGIQMCIRDRPSAPQKLLHGRSP